MLVIRIEIHPAEDGEAREVATVRVHNAGEAADGRALYGVTRDGSDQQVTVRHWRNDGALRLAETALHALLRAPRPAPGDVLAKPDRPSAGPAGPVVRVSDRFGPGHEPKAATGPDPAEELTQEAERLGMYDPFCRTCQQFYPARDRAVHDGHELFEGDG